MAEEMILKGDRSETANSVCISKRSLRAWAPSHEVMLLSLVFPPDSVSTAQIMGDLASDLDACGYHITVISTMPHYNRDPEAESRQPIKPLWGPILRRSFFRGITVYHTYMPRKGRNILFRVLAWLCFHAVSIVAALTVAPRPSVIIAPSPPLTIGICAWILSVIYHVPYIYNVQEIYPDMAIRLGAVRNRRVIDLLYRLERFVYRKASALTVIAWRMRERLLEKGVPGDKVQMIPNFVDVSELTPLSKVNDFSVKYSLNDKFVVSYAGNLGPAQGLEYFIDAACLLRDEESIRFLIMGDGILSEVLKQRIRQFDLPSFLFLPYQPYSLMAQAYAASDLCLVPQAPETGFEAVPSKVYRIMACARSVLAVTDSSSDLARLIVDAGCGAVVQPGSAEAIADVIRQASINPETWKNMGLKGREHVVHHYSRNTVSNQYHELVERLVRKSDRKSGKRGISAG